MCSKDCYRRKIHLNKKKVYFCSDTCRGNYQKTGKIVFCENCNKEIYRRLTQLGRSKTGKYFCSHSCFASHYNPIYKTKDITVIYRSKALKHYGLKCSNPNCALTVAGIEITEKMLDVHHKDKNRLNNRLDNLEVLCVWCHSIVTRLKKF